jgi:hypothetical protein
MLIIIVGALFLVLIGTILVLLFLLNRTKGDLVGARLDIQRANVSREKAIRAARRTDESCKHLLVAIKQAVSNTEDLGVIKATLAQLLGYQLEAAPARHELPAPEHIHVDHYERGEHPYPLPEPAPGVQAVQVASLPAEPDPLGYTGPSYSPAWLYVPDGQPAA